MSFGTLAHDARLVRPSRLDVCERSLTFPPRPKNRDPRFRLPDLPGVFVRSRRRPRTRTPQTRVLREQTRVLRAQRRERRVLARLAVRGGAAVAQDPVVRRGVRLAKRRELVVGVRAASRGRVRSGSLPRLPRARTLGGVRRRASLFISTGLCISTGLFISRGPRGPLRRKRGNDRDRASRLRGRFARRGPRRPRARAARARSAETSFCRRAGRRAAVQTVTARERTVRADGVCGDASSRFRAERFGDRRRVGLAGKPGAGRRGGRGRGVGAFCVALAAPARRRRRGGATAPATGSTGGGGGGDALRARRGDCRVPGRGRDVPARFTRVNCSARLSSAAAAAPTLLCGEQKMSVSGVSGDRSRAEGSEGLRAESSRNAARAPAVAGEGGRVLGRRILEGVTRAAESVARHVLQER